RHGPARQRSTAGYGPDDQERLLPRRDGLRQGSVLRFVGHVPPAGEKPDERPAPPRRAVADGSAEHRVGRLDRVDEGALGGPAPDLEDHRAARARKGAKVRRENDLDHGSVCTSTDSTAGRSRTIGAQESPLSLDAYTCPPVVPKYTPHDSSESTAMASRSTLTKQSRCGRPFVRGSQSFPPVRLR